jgi:hypothetical protein
MEFNMLTSTKQASIAIAVTLALGMPLSPAYAALAAELTNHLVDGAVLIPGATGTLPELQQVGFHYVK